MNLVNFAPLGSLTVYVTSFDRSCFDFLLLSDCSCSETDSFRSMGTSTAENFPHRNSRHTRINESYGVF